ncbi:hypothetical protein B0I37DRAFT_6149 [Chaetomium sp. MPI-CAGE-AT-0009]|nr:hypothetical protein B0I37DRAFT_6149 [Chaetomium sp. MPI-CAGE-AT-0009]
MRSGKTAVGHGFFLPCSVMLALPVADFAKSLMAWVKVPSYHSTNKVPTIERVTTWKMQRPFCPRPQTLNPDVSQDPRGTDAMERGWRKGNLKMTSTWAWEKLHMPPLPLGVFDVLT